MSTSGTSSSFVIVGSDSTSDPLPNPVMRQWGHLVHPDGKLHFWRRQWHRAKTQYWTYTPETRRLDRVYAKTFLPIRRLSYWGRDRPSVDYLSTYTIIIPKWFHIDEGL